MNSLNIHHLQAAFRFLRYLKGNIGLDHIFKRNQRLILEIYIDADFVGSLVDQRSTTWICTFLGGCLITWISKKQTVVSRSMTKAELRALAQGLMEGMWVKRILDDLKVSFTLPMKLLCDNKSAIFSALDLIQHGGMWHADIHWHFTKEKLTPV